MEHRASRSLGVQGDESNWNWAGLAACHPTKQDAGQAKKAETGWGNIGKAVPYLGSTEVQNGLGWVLG